MKFDEWLEERYRISFKIFSQHVEADTQAVINIEYINYLKEVEDSEQKETLSSALL